MARATPTDPYPDRTHMVQLVDFETHDYTPYGMEDTEIGERCYFKLPLDFPGFMRIIRRVDKIKEGRKRAVMDHLATTLEITMHNGQRFWLKYDRKKNKFTISTQPEEDEKPTRVKTWDMQPKGHE